MKITKLNQVKRYISVCLMRLGYYYAAANVLETDDKKLIAKYADQVKNNYGYWPAIRKASFDEVVAKLYDPTLSSHNN